MDSLTPDSKGVNLLVRVVGVCVVLERTKIDGTPLRIAEVLVGDHTGTVIITCKNGQSNRQASAERGKCCRIAHVRLLVVLALSAGRVPPRPPEQVDLGQVGAWLYVRNAKVQMFANRVRLAVDRWGLIEAVPADQQPTNDQVATEDEKNVSLPEYQLIECPQ